MMAGMLLGVLLYRPIFQELYETADVSKKQSVPVPNAGVEKSDPGPSTDNSVTGTLVTYQVFEDETKLKSVTKVLKDGKEETKKEITLGEGGKWKMIFLIALMVLFVTMVYGPIAAFLVELFPTKIRYTSMSLPYHIGNGVFGGLVPFIATLITTIKGTDHLSGLWYPIGVAGLSFIIGCLYLSNKPGKEVTD